MIWYSAVSLILILYPVFGFPKGKVTEKPQIPNSVSPKHRKASSHISEFTDPDTGLNPFLDIEEGQASMGRNVMEDEIRDETPYFDIDLVEGDAPNRRWGLPDTKGTVEKVPTIGRWPAVDYKDENYDFPVVTTPLIIPSSPTIEVTVIKVTEKTKAEDNNLNKGLQTKEQGGKKSVVVTQSTLIYVSASIIAVATIILIAGACWWKRKLKTPQSTARVENGDAKS